MLEFLQCTSRVLQYYINIDFMQVADMQSLFWVVSIVAC